MTVELAIRHGSSAGCDLALQRGQQKLRGFRHDPAWPLNEGHQGRADGDARGAQDVAGQGGALLPVHL